MKKALKIPARILCWDLCPNRESHPLGSPAARVPVLPGSGHGAQSLCALLKDLQGAPWGLLKSTGDFLLVQSSAAQGGATTTWLLANFPSLQLGTHQPNQEMKRAPIFWGPLLLIALKITSGGLTFFKSPLLVEILVWSKDSAGTHYIGKHTQNVVKGLKDLSFQLLQMTDQLFSSHHLSSGIPR